MNPSATTAQDEDRVEEAALAFGELDRHGGSLRRRGRAWEGFCARPQTATTSSPTAISPSSRMSARSPPRPASALSTGFSSSPSR